LFVFGHYSQGFTLGWDRSRRWRYSPFSRISRLKINPLGGLGVLAVQHQQGGLVLVPAEL
jgi:hypothetical protein